MTSNAQAKIGIIGGGAVGRAIAAFYPQAVVYDKYTPAEPIEKAAAAEFIFVAVPTPFQNGAPDLTEMDDAISTVAAHLTHPENQVVIIKSTVLPGTTDRYQKQYPNVNFIFNPEFLTERTAREDFAAPDKQLVGFTLKSRPVAEKVLAILPPAPARQILPATAAELAKYAINSFYAFKVIFGNTLYEMCARLNVDYEFVHEALARDTRIIDSHFDVTFGGYRGYGGKCLPKDIQTLAWFGREYGFDPKFIQTIIDLNDKLLAEKHL